jgi:hypothetical protein
MEDAIDKNLFWTAIVFFISPLMLHAAWWQALVLAVAMTVCWFLSYGQRVIRAFGVIMLLWGLLTWLGLLPSPDRLLPGAFGAVRITSLLS